MDTVAFDEGNFVFTYPVFFLLDPTPPVSFVSRPLIGLGGYGIHVFTDEPAAEYRKQRRDSEKAGAGERR